MEKSHENEHPISAFGWAARDSSGVLSPFNFSRRVMGEKDVQFKVLYCGICHTDLHQIKNEWGNSKYPIIPGHEIVGVVTEVGNKVEKFKVGDKIDVGYSAAAGSLDGIIDTVSAAHPLFPLLNFLKTNGKLVLVGAPEKLLELPVYSLLSGVRITWKAGRKLVAGSSTGGVKEIQEMVSLTAKHGITPDVEVVPMDYVNTALERLVKSDVKYRFVLDIGNTLNKS